MRALIFIYAGPDARMVQTLRTSMGRAISVIKWTRGSSAPGKARSQNPRGVPDRDAST